MDTKQVLNEEEKSLRLKLQQIDEGIGQKRDEMQKKEQELNDLFEQRSQTFGALGNLMELKKKLNIQDDGK